MSYILNAKQAMPSSHYQSQNSYFRILIHYVDLVLNCQINHKI